MSKKKKKRNLLWKVPQIIFRKCFITLKYKEGEVSGKKCLCVIIGLEACWLSGKESACQCRRHRFDPWSQKVPHTMEQLSLCVTTTEPVLWSLGATTPEPAC